MLDGIEYVRPVTIPNCVATSVTVVSSAPLRAPIVGATKLHHLDDANASVKLKLTPEEPHPSCGDCPLTARSRPKRADQNIPKNRCRTKIPERMVETRAELPFIGDQVGLLKPRPGRPQRPVGTAAGGGIWRGVHCPDMPSKKFACVNYLTLAFGTGRID